MDLLDRLKSFPYKEVYHVFINKFEEHEISRGQGQFNKIMKESRNRLEYFVGVKPANETHTGDSEESNIYNGV